MSKNLVEDFFAKNQGYEIAVLATYGINLNFFENYLLKLDGLASCDSISIFTDSSTYETFLNDTNNYFPRWLNKKYLVTSIKTGGIFHPKVYLMASEKRAKIAIGSANLTREGIASNLEIISLFEVTEKENQYASLLNDCIMFFNRLAQYSRNKVVQERINELVDITSKLVRTNVNTNVSFLHNLDKPLIKQLQKLLQNKNVDRIKVLSPFYDAELNILEALRKVYPNTVIEIYIQQAKSNFPVDKYKKSRKIQLYLYKGIERYMHGKAILFECESENYLFTGSANFTDSALMTSNYSANVEAGLFGIIENKYADELFKPMNKSAEKVKRFDMIKTIKESEEIHSSIYKPNIYFIIEALEEDELIYLNLNNEVLFKPDKLLLYKIDGKIEVNFNTKINLKHLGISSKDVYALQAISFADKDKPLLSNTVWISRLEKKEGNNDQKKYRRIFNNPFELVDVLNEIISSGDEEKLKQFLKTFDIPLDLLLVPSYLNSFIRRESKGNIVGELHKSHCNFFEMQNIIQLFKYFLDRLMRKLCIHYDNIQLQKLPNFILIFATLFSMIEFINTKIYEDNIKEKIVTAAKWVETRDYYNMLLSYIKDVWTLLWIDTEDKKSFRLKVNNKIKRDKKKILGDIQSIEAYILRDYLFLYKKSLKISEEVISNFIKLRETLKVQTVVNTIIKPPVFESDIYINEIRDIYNMLLKCKFYKNESSNRK